MQNFITKISEGDFVLAVSEGVQGLCGGPAVSLGKGLGLLQAA